MEILRCQQATRDWSGTKLIKITSIQRCLIGLRVIFSIWKSWHLVGAQQKTLTNYRLQSCMMMLLFDIDFLCQNLPLHTPVTHFSWGHFDQDGTDSTRCSAWFCFQTGSNGLGLLPGRSTLWGWWLSAWGTCRFDSDSCLEESSWNS